MEKLHNNYFGKSNTTHQTSEIIKNLCQEKSINEDLQHLWLILFNIKNSLLKSWLEKTLSSNTIDDDSYRCFIKIYDFINSYQLHELEKLVSNYKKLYVESESKLLHINTIKKEQILFLKKTFAYILGDFMFLQERIKNRSLVFIKENAFHKRLHKGSDKEHIQELSLFLSEFPSRINSIEEFLTTIDLLWSKKTKEKLEQYRKIEKYL